MQLLRAKRDLEAADTTGILSVVKGYNVPHAVFNGAGFAPTKDQMLRCLNWIKRYGGQYVRFDLAMNECFATGMYAFSDHEFLFREIKKRGLKCWFVINEDIPNRTKWREIEGIEWKPDTPFLYPWWNIPNIYWAYLNQNVQSVLDLANSVFNGLDGHLVEDGNERCNTYDNDQIPFLPYGEMPNNFLDRQLTRWNHSDRMNLHGAKWIGSSLEGGHAYLTELKSSQPLIVASGCLNVHCYGQTPPKYSLPVYIGEISNLNVPKRKRSLDLRNLVSKYGGCGYAAMSLTDPQYSVLS